MKKNILFIVSMLLFFSCSIKNNISKNTSPVLRSANNQVYNRKSPISDEERFVIAEVMPAIASCGDNDLHNRTGACTNKKLADFIYKNLKYPEKEKGSGIVGIVAVKFVVTQDGSIEDIGIKCNKISGTGEQRKEFADEAIRVVEEMKRAGIKWNAGKQGGEKVNALYYFPVMFRNK